MTFRWRTKPGTDITLHPEPTFLTDEQIDFVLQSFPIISAADLYAATIARNEILKDLRRQLINVEVSLSPALPGEMPIEIYHLIDHIGKRYREARVPAGNATGNEAADAFGAITQKALDTFKTGDTGAVRGGIKELQAKVYAYRKRSFARCVVHFVPRVTYRDVIDMKGIIVQSLISDFFLQTPDIIPLIRPDAPIEISYDLFQPQWWHIVYQRLTGRVWGVTNNNSYCLRLYLDTVKMYDRRVSMNDIRKAVRLTGDVADVVCSPLRDGIIDIVPDDDLVKKYWAEYSESVPDPIRVYLDLVVRPTLSTTRIKGIPNILDLEPIEQKTTSLIVDPARPSKRELAINPKLTQYDKEGLWRNDINNRIARTVGIRIGDLIKLILRAGITIVDLVINEYREIKSIYTYHESGARPADMLNKLIKKNKGDIDISRWGSYVYAVTTGTNLVELQKIPWVDKTRTASNNTYEIARLFGVEAARAYALWETLEIMKVAGMIVSPHHPLLVLDVMYRRGVPLGVNFSGIAKQQGGDFLGLATTEKAAAVFRNAALYGEKAPVNTFAASVIIGAVAPVGSNSDALLDQEKHAITLREKVKAWKEMQARGGPKSTASKINPQKVNASAAKLKTLSTSVDAMLDPNYTGEDLGVVVPKVREGKVGTRIIAPGADAPRRLPQDPVGVLRLPQATIETINSVANDRTPLTSLRPQSVASALGSVGQRGYDYPEPFANEERDVRVYDQPPEDIRALIGVA